MNSLEESVLGRVVLGVGTDLVEVARIRSALERHGDRFLHRLYTEEEIAYCQKQRDPHPFLAAGFAAAVQPVSADTITTDDKGVILQANLRAATTISSARCLSPGCAGRSSVMVM